MWAPGPGTPQPAAKEMDTSKRVRSAEPAQSNKTQLSGATRNMRFMQRGNTAHNNNKSKAEGEYEGNRNGSNDQFAKHFQERQRDPNMNDPDKGAITSEAHHQQTNKKRHDVVKVATPLDMYGREQCLVLGRRSFGGFNPVTAENWYAQTQHHRHDEKASSSSSRKGSSAISDEELLKRYKSLVHNRNNNNNDHRRSRSPSSGPTKKKRGISNQTKRKT